jgi:hypothetical protein
MLKQSRSRPIVSWRLDHGRDSLDKFSRASGAGVNRQSSEVEGSRGGQSSRYPAATGPRPGSGGQSRFLEAAGFGCGGDFAGGSLGEPVLTDVSSSLVPGQRHDPSVVADAIHGVVKLSTSLRGVCGWLARKSRVVIGPDTIRNWLGRVGCHLLSRPVERRDDWVVILDHTMQLGPSRCLLVVGTPLRSWQAKGGPLSHADLHVLMVEVVTSSTGDVVHDQLRRLVARIGVPAQVISDGGGDLAKGIALLRDEHPETIGTYDITHKLACLLKAELEPDARWHEYVQRAGQSRARLQQARGGLASPPSLRNKARYQNLEGLVTWGEAIGRLTADPGTVDRLAVQRGTTREESRRWLAEMVGWVAEFAGNLSRWRGLLTIIAAARDQIQRDGLHADSSHNLRRRLRPIATHNRRFAAATLTFVAAESSRIPRGQRYPGCSDVIESVFGKYKRYLERSPSPSLGSNVLLFPLFVTQMTVELVREAMTAVKQRTAHLMARALGGPSRKQLQKELRSGP